MFSRNLRFSLLMFAVGGLAIIAAAIIVFGGAIAPYYAKKFELSAYAEPVLDYRLADYGALAGWLQDDPTAAFSAFLNSCAEMGSRDAAAPANPHEYLGAGLGGVSFSGAVADWRAPCRAAVEIDLASYANPSGLRAAVRTFFEIHFQPVEIRQRRAPLPNGPARRAPPRLETSGVFTGYFEPVFDASPQATTEFEAAVYGRPADLVDVDLGLFRDRWAGERLAGRVEGQSFVPYPDRHAIENGALDQLAPPLAWMRPDDLFFLQIQGSGRLQFPDGETVRVGYAGQNGHPYTAIGRVMVERGIMPLEKVSMGSIRA